jgi:hypothetical protein
MEACFLLAGPECIQINDKMFGYDANKQASIGNPDAGTYRQLVKAAESCQVSIIHPGKPRNPDAQGLEELKARAEPYLYARGSAQAPSTCTGRVSRQPKPTACAFPRSSRAVRNLGQAAIDSRQSDAIDQQHGQ